jgi:hypothetical protein
MSKDMPKREGKKPKQTKTKEQSDYKKGGSGIITPINPFGKKKK